MEERLFVRKDDRGRIQKTVRHPRIESIKRTTVRMIKRGGGSRTVRRWYVTLRFGRVRERLAVSNKVASWVKGNK